MNVKQLVLIISSILFIDTTAKALLTREQCSIQCTTKETCKFTFKRRQCETDCQGIFKPDLCGPSVTLTPQQVEPEAKSPQKPPSQKQVVEQHMAPQGVRQPGKAPMVAQIQGQRALPQSPAFKTFSADLSAALKVCECLSKSISVKHPAFKKNVFQALRSRIKKSTLQFNKYSAYLEAMNNYHAALLNPFLYEQVIKFAKDELQPNQYPIILKEFMERAVTLAQNIAIQIPGYNQSSEFINALPQQVQNDFKQCANNSNIKFINDDLNTFKNNLLQGISAKKYIKGGSVQ